MTYEKPELVVVDSASELVLGYPLDFGDPGAEDREHIEGGIVAGLD